jgi:hypothetical protein
MKNPLVNKDPLRPVKRWGVDREVVDEGISHTVFSTLLEFPPADGRYFLEPDYESVLRLTEVEYMIPTLYLCLGRQRTLA